MKEFPYEIVQQQCCGTCAHYRRHYVMVRHPGYRYFMPLHYGHCVDPQRKTRAPEQCCPRWEETVPVPLRRGGKSNSSSGKRNEPRGLRGPLIFKDS